MKPEIRKIVTRSTLLFGILAVSVAGMKLTMLQNEKNTRSAPRDAAVFIVDSCLLTSPLFTAQMIVVSINLQRNRIYTHFRGFLIIILNRCHAVSANETCNWKSIVRREIR